MVNKIVEYGQNVFHVGRSGVNIVARPIIGDSTEIKKLRQAFLPNRVMAYWNKLPISVKLSSDVISFKKNLEDFKSSSICTLVHKISGKFHS